MMHIIKKRQSYDNHHVWLQQRHKVESEYDAGLLEFTFYSRRKLPLAKGIHVTGADDKSDPAIEGMPWSHLLISSLTAMISV